MFEVLASYGFFGGGEISTLLMQFEQMGVFSYLLPFLVIFALVFGLISQMKLFHENKSIPPIIALAVALMALQFDLVPRFFAEIFPRLGVGLVILLVVLILIGLVSPKDASSIYLVYGAMIVVAIYILVDVAEAMNSPLADLWYQWRGTIIFVTVFILIVVFIINMNKTKQEKTTFADVANGLWTRATS